jgi:hypothetical protein
MGLTRRGFIKGLLGTAALATTLDPAELLAAAERLTVTDSGLLIPPTLEQNKNHGLA